MQLSDVIKHVADKIGGVLEHKLEYSKKQPEKFLHQNIHTPLGLWVVQSNKGVLELKFTAIYIYCNLYLLQYVSEA